MAGVMMAVQLTESQARRAVPIHGVPLELFNAQVGSPDLAMRMRKNRWIFPVCEKPLLFSTAHVAGCWARIENGELPETHPGGGVRVGA